MSSTCGTRAFSSAGLYGIGVCTPFRRRTGASRSAKARSITWEEISAPIAHGANVSSTMRSRPVLWTDSRMVSISSGARVLGSMTSTEMFCFSSCSQAVRVSPTILEMATTVTSLPWRAIAALPKGMV